MASRPHASAGTLAEPTLPAPAAATRTSVALHGPVAPATVDEARRVLSRHAKSFKVASLLLPAARRDDAAVVYAFCRLVDDAADEAPSLAVAERDLSRIRLELDGLAAPRPIVSAFLDVARRRRVPLDAARELMVGVESDLHPVRVSDDGELVRYGYRVAGTVGLMMCGVIGVPSSRLADAEPHAVDLGVGMQITNICRDVLEDAGRGRVYLPADRLEAAGTSTEALLAGDADRAAIASVVRDLLALADRYYASGRDGFHAIPLRPRAAIAAAADIYQAIGQELARRGHDPLRGRVWVRTPKKVRLLLGALAGSWTWSTVRRRHAHDAALHAPLAGFAGCAPRAAAGLSAPPASVPHAAEEAP